MFLLRYMCLVKAWMYSTVRHPRIPKLNLSNIFQTAASFIKVFDAIQNIFQTIKCSINNLVFQYCSDLPAKYCT